MNSFGGSFRITLFGESHGKTVGIVIDGVQPGLPLLADDFMADLDRRRGGGRGTTPRTESDVPEITSGIYNGFTTGAPITIIFSNGDTKPADYAALSVHPRPSHADMAAATKYDGYNDPRGGGMFSGRMTAGLVAAGVVAKKILPCVTFDTRITEIGGCRDTAQYDTIIAQAASSGDSVGGIVEVVVRGAAVGTGEPFFDSIESVVAHLLFSVPGVKGVEFGAGFASARHTGSLNNDLITDAKGTTVTNNDGGINGGIANGNDIVLRVAFKPTPSISAMQMTFNKESGTIAPLSIKGRHDACIALRGAVVAEAAAAIAIADLTMRMKR